jgi:type II secretory pathway predicted ATPase ExeA
MGSRYNRVEQCLPGTCQWIFQKREYLDWLELGTSGAKRSFLWIKGKAGSGKSTLMKTIIQRIRALPSQPLVISFFFDARGNLLERSPSGLFRTLTRELINERPHLLESLLLLYRKMLETRQEEWRMHDLLQWFKQTMDCEQVGPVYVFIDALDECDNEDMDQRTSRDHETNARTLVRFFESLMISSTESRNPLLLCLSSRHYPHITVRADIRLFEVFMEGENDLDIRKFIDTTLASSSLDTDLMQHDLCDMIARRSRGVFLWAILVIQALLRARDQGRPRSQWRVILDGIPTTLNETFRQTMDNLKDEDRLESAILFQILLLGEGSMSLECVRHAFGFTVREPPASLEMWEQSDAYLPEEAFKKRIQDLSCGLVEVNTGSSATGRAQRSEHQTVQFIHETVKTFLAENNYANLVEFHPNTGQSRSGKAYELVMQACLNYIATSDAFDAAVDSSRIYFLGEPAYARSRVPFLEYAARWLHDYMGSAEMISSERLQTELYRRLRGPSNNVFKTWKGAYYFVTPLKELQGRSDFYIRSVADFFDYAAIRGLSHSVLAGLRDSSGAGPRVSGGVTPLMRLLEYQHDDGARVLVAQGMDVRARDDLGRSVLYYAQSVEMVEMLLHAGAEVNGIRIPAMVDHLEVHNPELYGIGLNALMYHIKDARIVECLLQHGADVDEKSMTGKTALQYASSGTVARLIIAKRPPL